MKTWIEITSEKYYVNPTSRVVVCTLTFDLHIENHPSWACISATMWEKKYPNITWGKLNKVKAIAKCNSLDTFDEVKGRRIANSRAKAKMFKIAQGVWAEIAKTLYEMAYRCSVTGSACHEAEKLERDHVKELIK